MKLFKFISLIIVVFLEILLKGCNSNQNEFDAKTHIPESEELMNLDFSEVYLNPFDYVGKYHNEGLRYVFNNFYERPKVKSLSNEAQIDFVKSLVTEFCREKPIVEEMEEDYDFLLENIVTKSASGNIFENQTQQEFYEKVLALYKNEKILSPQDFITEINKIEKSIANSDLSEIERSQLLISTAVAKYSASFWMEQMLLNSQTPLIKTRTSENVWLDWFRDVFMPKAEKVLEADMAGAAAGAVEGLIFGGAVGSIVPGAGTVTVAITGAVADGAKGAIWGSACEGIGIHWTFWN